MINKDFWGVHRNGAPLFLYNDSRYFIILCHFDTGSVINPLFAIGIKDVMIDNMRILYSQ